MTLLVDSVSRESLRESDMLPALDDSSESEVSPSDGDSNSDDADTDDVSSSLQLEDSALTVADEDFYKLPSYYDEL